MRNVTNNVILDDIQLWLMYTEVQSLLSVICHCADPRHEFAAHYLEAAALTLCLEFFVLHKLIIVIHDNHTYQFNVVNNCSNFKELLDQNHVWNSFMRRIWAVLHAGDPADTEMTKKTKDSQTKDVRSQT